jgi:hypothetical protein
MLTFVANDEKGLPQKRKHVQRAYDECRRRKKRCGHLDNAQVHDQARKDTDIASIGPIGADVAQVARSAVPTAITASNSPHHRSAQNHSYLKQCAKRLQAPLLSRLLPVHLSTTQSQHERQTNRQKRLLQDGRHECQELLNPWKGAILSTSET